MAKSGKPNPKPQAQAAKNTPPTPKKSTPPRDLLAPPPADGPDDAGLRKAFYVLSGVALLLMLWLAMGSGVNADDKFQVDYSTKLVNYYGTFGRDTAALNIPDGNMHLYGGFFEIVAGFTNKALGFQDSEAAYHQVRHLWSAFFGWVAILCAALLARRIAGWRAGLIAFVLLLLSPRFVGDSLMNPKDIPFAAGYMMALYNLAAVLDRMPRPGRWHLAGLAGGLAISLATRAGGLLSFGYVFLFAGLHFLLKNGGLAGLSQTTQLRKYLLVTLGTVAAGYIVALLFWPFALQHPFTNVKYALDKFADLEVRIRVLYDGVNVMSSKTAWHYPLKWMALTIPLAALAGFAGALALLPRSVKLYVLIWAVCGALSYWSPVAALAIFAASVLFATRILRENTSLWMIMAIFAAVFPVFYVIRGDSVIHDGWRHLTFVYPPLCVVAAVFWHQLASFFTEKKALQWAVYGAFALLLADSAWFIAANRSYPYVYFNPLAGGIKGAFGHYETDYWGVSTRQGIEWMEQQGILRPDMSEPVVIATNMHYSAKQFLTKYGDKVKLKYLKWDRRYDDAWDYALYPTRFLEGVTLQGGHWPPSNTIHTVDANGVPILAILRDTSKACALGMAAVQLQDWNSAIPLLNQAVAEVPDNELGWSALAQAYLSVDSLELAKAAAEKALAIIPNDSQVNNMLALYWVQKDDLVKAEEQFELAVKRNPANASAWYYLAVFAKDRGEAQQALLHLQKAIQAAPTFKQAYELAAQIYEAAGDAKTAKTYRAAAQQIR